MNFLVNGTKNVNLIMLINNIFERDNNPLPSNSEERFVS